MLTSKAPSRAEEAPCELPIFEVAPGLARRPFVPLVDRPTPVESFDERIWVKRDDRVSPVYGGNKVRRWEWLFGAARARGIDTLVTVGGLGSTQVTSLTAHGVRAGFTVRSVLFDQPRTAFVDEALSLDARFGGDALEAGSYVRTAFETLRALRRTPRSLFVPPGASTPLLNVAYVDAMLELGKQVERGELPRPDRIVVACGSGGTAVGLAIGAAILGWPTIVTAVRITELLVSNPLTLRALAFGTVRLLEREGMSPRPKLAPRLTMDHRFVGRGYGYTTPEAEIGARTFTERFDAPGEITYSGKAIAALDRVAKEHPRDSILLWNTLSSTGRS